MTLNLSSTTMMYVLVMAIGIAVGYAFYNGTGSPKPVPLGREIRSKSVIKELELINAFRDDFRGQMDPEKHRKELLSKIHRFERNRGVRVLRNTIFSEGPILLSEF